MNLDQKTISTIVQLLAEKRQKEKEQEANVRYTKIKDVLLYIAFFGSLIFAPKATVIFRPLLTSRDKYPSWKSFNFHYLRQSLRRLEKRQLINIKKEKEGEVIQLTEQGSYEILRLGMDELSFEKPKKWDHYWRFVLYDISNKKKNLRIAIRKTLLRFGFVQFQESVYLYPYPCKKEIEMIKNYYDLTHEIKLITAIRIENEEAYKTYFALP